MNSQVKCFSQKANTFCTLQVSFNAGKCRLSVTLITFDATAFFLALDDCISIFVKFDSEIKVVGELQNAVFLVSRKRGLCNLELFQTALYYIFVTQKNFSYQYFWYD